DRRVVRASPALARWAAAGVRRAVALPDDPGCRAVRLVAVAGNAKTGALPARRAIRGGRTAAIAALRGVQLCALANVRRRRIHAVVSSRPSWSADGEP